MWFLTALAIAQSLGDTLTHKPHTAHLITQPLVDIPLHTHQFPLAMQYKNFPTNKNHFTNPWSLIVTTVILLRMWLALLYYLPWSARTHIKVATLNTRGGFDLFTKRSYIAHKCTSTDLDFMAIIDSNHKNSSQLQGNTTHLPESDTESSLWSELETDYTIHATVPEKSFSAPRWRPSSIDRLVD